MKILMISPHVLDPTLGAAKVVIELSGALNALPGVQCDLAGADALGLTGAVDAEHWTAVNEAHRRFVAAQAGRYDVVDYDHEHLPFDRSLFPRNALLVARSVLLVHHAEKIHFPQPRTVRAMVGRLTRGRGRAAFQRRRIADANTTLAAADAIDVSNHHDKAELVSRGFAEQKITVLPFGLSAKRRAELESVPLDVPIDPTVVFVGTFDYRKGAVDIPVIFERIRAGVPNARLLLLGTQGMFQTAERVLSTFPAALRPHVSVRTRFEPSELPGQLAACSVGIFPSYCEGFAFAVLEMLASGIPVVAYDAPGPPMMLDFTNLVNRGDTQAMADKVIAWLRDRLALAAARLEARQSSRRFDWAPIAADTVTFYLAGLDRNRQVVQ